MFKYPILFIIFFIIQKNILENSDNYILLDSAFKIILLYASIEYVLYINNEHIIF